MITASQCRAARALLNWSQPDLAAQCDIHVQTISNFENENSTPSKNTLDKITYVLEQAGISFLEDNGLRLRQMAVQELHGSEGFKQFMDDVYKTAHDEGGEICLLNARPDNWIKWLGAEWMAFHSDRMEKIRDRFTFRITTKEGEYNFISRAFAEYRWVPKDIWNQHSYYAYGDKIAFLNFDANTVDIFIFKHPPFAQTHKFLFNLVWNNHTIIPDVPDHKPGGTKKIAK